MTLAALASLATALNNGTSATFTPADTVALLSNMEANAVELGKAIGTAETAIAESAKSWGCNFLNLVKVHGIDGDTLAERCRTALGWPDLRGDAGSKVKTRFNTWRSNIGKVSGAFDTLEETVRNELLGGTRSFITVYKAIMDDEKKAKREADAAKAAAEKALEDAAALAAANDAAPVTDVAPVEATSIADLLASLLLAIDAASDDELNATYADMEAVVGAYDARINAAAPLEAVAA